MKSIYLNKQTVSVLSHNSFMAYVGLKAYIDKSIIVTSNPKIIKAYVTTDILIYSLIDTFNFKDITRTFRTNIDNGLKELIENDIIYVIEQDGKNYMLDLCNLYIDVKSGDEYFTMSDDEIKKILSIKARDKFSFLHYALTMFSTIWNGKDFGCNSIDDLCNKCGVTNPTAFSYNTLLEENFLVYIERNDYSSRDEDGVIKRQANTYGRYENREKVINASMKYGSRVFDKTKSLASNLKSSIKQRYNSYVNGTYKGSIKKLYDDVLKYNDDDNTKFTGIELDLTIFPTIIEENNMIEEKEYESKGKSDVFEVEVKDENEVDYDCPFDIKPKQSIAEQLEELHQRMAEYNDEDDDNLFVAKEKVEDLTEIDKFNNACVDLEERDYFDFDTDEEFPF